jgi:hypothetical protein
MTRFPLDPEIGIGLVPSGVKVAPDAALRDKIHSVGFLGVQAFIGKHDRLCV